MVDSTDVYVVCNVYGPHDVASRAEIFRKIGGALDGVVGRLVVGGYTRLNDGERRGAGGDTVGDSAFKEFVQDNFLIDLPQLNGDFTWYSGRWVVE